MPRMAPGPQHTLRALADWQSRWLRWVALSITSCKLLPNFLIVFKENLKILILGYNLLILKILCMLKYSCRLWG